jgi:hypothetical protein
MYNAGIISEMEAISMPITKELLASVKQTNVSKDIEKTKQRVKDDFSALKSKQKEEVVVLSGINRTSIYRVFKTGAVSAKIVLAMAQNLNVSPFYYTGEADDKGVYSEEALASFLIDKGYAKLVQKKGKPGPKLRVSSATKESKPVKAKAKKPTAAKTKKPAIPKADKAAAPTASERPAGFQMETACCSPAFSSDPAFIKAANGLTREKANQLLDALYIRAEAGGQAAQLLDCIKKCLMS